MSESQDFGEIKELLVSAILQDYADSPYRRLSVYWRDHISYWSRVFSEGCFKAISVEIENYIKFEKCA